MGRCSQAAARKHGDMETTMREDLCLTANPVLSLRARRTSGMPAVPVWGNVSPFCRCEAAFSKNSPKTSCSASRLKRLNG
jgi:hypothetical protein